MTLKNPTTNYPLDLAVEEKYLVPYQVVKHTTKFLRDGINGQSLTADQVLEIEDQGIDPNTLEFSSSQIDQAIFNKDTNRKNSTELDGSRDFDKPISKRLAKA